ncbi:hypothetical protein E2C01_059602 [Portunus trituberculatus]|uniref:Uncharacterized protein n=1 Tax=Portunus trituberculatus TaxID=210409 RepID=A0A5B7H8V8_PORTR|nr:hypothetical protein [Portunus trituberculatus]
MSRWKIVSMCGHEDYLLASVLEFSIIRALPRSPLHAEGIEEKKRQLLMSLTLHILSARKRQGQWPRQVGSGARLPLVTGGPACLPVSRENITSRSKIIRTTCLLA